MDAHDHVGARLARAQGYRDRVGVTRERRAVLVNGSPPGIEGGPPADLFRRQPQDPLGAGVRRLQPARSEEHTSELQSRLHLVCRLLLEKKKIVATQSPYPLDSTELAVCDPHHV